MPRIFLPFFLLISLCKIGHSQVDFTHWMDTIKQDFNQRKMQKAFRLSSSAVDHFQDRPTEKDLAFAYLFKAKGYQLLSRFEEGLQTIDTAYHLIRTHHPQNDSMLTLVHKYHADIVNYMGQVDVGDSLLDVALQHVDQSYGAISNQKGLIYMGKQLVNWMYNRLYQTLENSKKAYDIAIQVHDSLAPAMLAYEVNLGVAYSELDKLKEASYHYDRATRILEAMDSEDQSDRLQILNNVGVVENSKGNFDKALAYFEEGIKIYEAGGAPGREDLLLQILYNGSYSLVKLGDFKRAEQYINQSAQNINKDMPLYEKFSANIALEKATFARLAGDYDRAKSEAQKSLTRYKQSFGETHMDIIYPLYELGMAELEKDQFAQAIPYLEEALEILDINEMAVSENAGDFNGWLGEIHFLNQDYPLALSYFRRSLAVYREVYGEQNYNVAWCHSSIGETLRKMGYLDSSRISLDQAWAATFIQPEDYQSARCPTINQINPHVYLRDMIQDECQYHDALYRQSKDEGLLKKGLEFALLADQWIDGTRDRFQDEGESSARFLDKNFHFYEWGIQFCDQLNRIQNNSAYLDTAFYFAEKSRSSSLFSMIRGIQLRNPERIPSDIVDQVEGYENDIAQIQRLIDEESSYGEDKDVEQIEKLKKRLFTVKESYSSMKREIKNQYPDYFAIRFDTTAATINEVQKLISSESSVIQYFVGDTAIYAFVINHDKMEMINLGPSTGLSIQVSAYNGAIKQLNAIRTNEIGDSIYKAVFQPLEKSIPGNKLIIIPDGPLHYLNFEALQDEEEQYLIERYVMTYDHSSTHFVMQSERSNERNTSDRWLGLAPGFSDEMKDSYRSRIPDEQWDEAYLSFLKQPNSVELVRKVAGQKPGATALIGEQATEKQFTSLIGEYGTIHFSTHAEINNIEPQLSRLILSKSDQTKSDDDGYLLAKEIYALPLAANLVVLTACNTGLGKLFRGEGFVSLARGFQYAGAQNIIMSLWSVDEQQSNQLMERFYANHDRGQPVAEALHQAKLEYLNEQTDDLKLPYYWAGMVAIGSVVNSSDPIVKYVLIGFIASLLIIGIAVLRTRVS